MTLVIAILLSIVNAVCLLLVLLGLPGTWLMVVTTVAVAWWRWDADGGAQEPMFGITVLILIVVLALLGEAFEFIAGAAGAKHAGGSRRGATGALLGALVGGIVGTIFIPFAILGSLVGTCGGAALGAWGFELYAGCELRPALRSGVGAGLGRLTGTLVKALIGALIWIVVTMAAFWP